MKTLEQHLAAIRDNIRGDEAILAHIVTQIPEQKKRALVSPYVGYILSTCVSVYALVLLIHPYYRDYQTYRVEAQMDRELMSLDMEEAAFEQQMDELDMQDLSSFQ